MNNMKKINGEQHWKSQLTHLYGTRKNKMRTRGSFSSNADELGKKIIGTVLFFSLTIMYGKLLFLIGHVRMVVSQWFTSNAFMFEFDDFNNTHYSWKEMTRMQEGQV